MFPVTLYQIFCRDCYETIVTFGNRSMLAYRSPRCENRQVSRGLSVWFCRQCSTARKIVHGFTQHGMSAAAPVLVPARVDQTQQRWHIEGIRFQLAVFATAFLIIFSRRPDALFNPQFFAEDGAFFYRDAYQLGLHSLLLTYSGYFQTLLRLAALFARLFPFAYVPLVMNLIGMTAQVLPVNVFLSQRFSQVPTRIRLLASFVYLGLPNSFELHVTATNLAWHQALLAYLVLLAIPAENRGWRVFDGITLVLASVSTPLAILLLPIAAVLWWRRGTTRSAASLMFLLPGVLLQGISVLLHWHARQAPHINFAGQVIFNGGNLGANAHDFISIIGRQVFFSSILGLNIQTLLVSLPGGAFVDVISTVAGIVILLYALRFGPIELRLFILFAYAVLALGLINPLAGTPDHTQWYWLTRPGCGSRYYFLPMIAFLASLFWVAACKTGAAAMRCVALMCLLLLPVGIYRDWQVPPFEDFRFALFAQKFESVPAGTTVVIPINPGWLMGLTKH